MKKRILQVSIFACLTLLTTISAMAQTSDRVWSFGPEVGASFYKHGMDDNFDSENRTGLVAGGFVTYSIRNTYGFTAKVLYSQRGMKGDFDGTDLNEKLTYVEIPILARLFFNREGNIRPNVFAGPSFGILTGSKWKIENGDYENVEDSEIQILLGEGDFKDTYNTFDFGVSAGLGLNIRVAKEMYFIVDARYTYGLSNIYANIDDSNNNQGVTLTAGLSFGLGN